MPHRPWPLVAMAALGALAALAAGAPTMAAERIARITVQAGKRDRIDTPVSAALPDLGSVTTPPRMEEITAGGAVPVPAQVETGSPPRLCWILAGKTPAGGKRVYDVWHVQADLAGAAGVEARAAKDGVEIVSGKALILRYHGSPVTPPAGVDQKFARGAYIHPACTPSGLIVTEDFPPDHLHQRGIWMSWTKTEFDGRHPDFWNLGGATGAIRAAGTPSLIQGPVFAGFVARHEWLDLAAPGGEKVILNETCQVRVWQVGGPGGGYWLWDLASTQRCASAAPLKLPKYHYGGLGYRGPPPWLKQVSMLTSEGKTRKDGNETKGRWCDVSGPLGDKAAGVLVMGHPQNFRHPEPLRLNPQQPQICFAPSQEGDWAIEPGKDYVWRYRFCIHDGAIKADEADRLWADFGDPPAVRIEK